MEGDSLKYLFEIWCRDNSMLEHKEIPYHIVWKLWLARNSRIFQGKYTPTIKIIHQIMYAYEGYWKLENVKTHKILKDLEYSKELA
jgi:hypothetical protein